MRPQLRSAPAAVAVSEGEAVTSVPMSRDRGSEPSPASSQLAAVINLLGRAASVIVVLQLQCMLQLPR